MSSVPLAVVVGHHDVLHVDPRLPPAQRLGHVVAGQVGGGRVVGREDQGPQVAAEQRTHHPLTVLGAEDDPDRLLDLRLAGGLGQARHAQLHRESQAAA